jgi:hypothetical protein
MSDLDRLREIDVSPPQQVHALLTLLVPPRPLALNSSPTASLRHPKSGSMKRLLLESRPPKPKRASASLTAN